MKGLGRGVKVSGQMVRTQLLLEPEQHRALAEMARQADRSMSDVAREILRQALVEKEKEARQQRAAAAMQRLNQLCEAAAPYAGDPIAEARIEREHQVDKGFLPERLSFYHHVIRAVGRKSTRFM